MANALSRIFGQITGPKRVNPYAETGVSGTPVYRGWIRTTEQSPDLASGRRYQTAANILTNVSIVAAGIRYFNNLVSDPKWRVEAVDDTPAAVEAKEFVEDVIFNMNTSWARIVRRSAMFRYHGFGIGEWTAERRDDGRIGIKDIEQRPQFTITQWGQDDSGAITGVIQTSPLDGRQIWLPRSKIVYLVDDMMTDSPEGMGWFRALAEPARRVLNLLKYETIGYERNFAGMPVGRAPIGELQALVNAGQLTKADMNLAVNTMREFVDTQAKSPNTGITLDSAPYMATSQDGLTPSAVAKWSLELLKGDMSGAGDLAKAIERGTHEMARIIGVESMLVGSDGVGSLALSSDKSRNLYLVVNSTLGDMSEAFDRDIVGPLWWLNGFPDELRPKLKTEDVAFKDVENIAAMLRDMASAGATLSPDDPAINDLRDLAGISRVPQEIIDRGVEIEMRPPSPNIGPDGKPLPTPTQPGGKPAAKFNPDQPRDPQGTATGGRWTAGGHSPAAVEALGEKGADQLKDAITNGEDADTILDILAPADDKAASIDPTIEGETPEDGFWEKRRYGERGITAAEARDALVAQANAYAGPEGPANDREAMIVIGSPAAGKSTSAEALAREGRFAIIDSDDAKKMIPEFAGGIGAGAVHEESKYLSNFVMGRMVEQGSNIMIPTVGHSVSSVERKIAALEGAGYKVSVLNVSVDRDVAARRMAGRFLSTGRLIETDYFRSIGDRPDRTYEYFKRQGKYGTAKIDANGAKGSERFTESTIAGYPQGRSVFGGK